MAPPTQTVQQTLADPKFYGLPAGEQQKVLATLDPNYARLPLQERTKVLQMGQQKWGPGAAATPAPTPSSDPVSDLTTNTIDPTTGTGYGLYRMGSYDFHEGQVTKPEILVPYNRVQDAVKYGYKLHPDEAPRYQQDTAHNGPLSHAASQVKSLLMKMTEPMPDTSLAGNAWQRANAVALNTEKLPFNVVNRAIRGLAGLPQGLVQTAIGISRGDPAALETFDPVSMAENSYRGFNEDAADIGPMAALGNLGGDAATMYAAGEYGPKVTEALPDSVVESANRVFKTPESVVRSATDTGAGPIKRLVKDRLAENEKINTTNSESQSHNTAAEQALSLRRQHEQAYQQATTEHYAREAAADVRAKTEENSAWSAWRKKIAGKTLDGGQITGPLGKLRLDSPEVDRTLNQLEPRGDEVPQESPYVQLRARVSQENFGKDYESLAPVKQDEVDDLLHNNGYSPDPIAFDPQAGQPISIDRVQRASSILQRYIRSGRFEGPLLGEMKQVAKVLRNAVTRASADAGAAPELDAARNATITYQDAFGRERKNPTTARTIREEQANPVAFKERADEERLAKARRYDPTLVDSYRQVKAARESLKKLPTEDQLRKGLRPIKPGLTISSADIQRAREEANQIRSNAPWKYGRYATAWPVFTAVRAVFGGHIQDIPAMAVEGVGGLATLQAASHLLRYPPMIKFLIKARPEDVALIPLELRGDLPGLVSIARRQGIKVAPALIAAAAMTTMTSQKQAPTQPLVQPASTGVAP